MNTHFSSESPLFQDRQLPETAPSNSWQQLTAGDERAERFEGLLRSALVVSLFCTVLVCGLRSRNVAAPLDRPQLAVPTVHQRAVICQAPAATPAMLPQTVALN